MLTQPRLLKHMIYEGTCVFVGAWEPKLTFIYLNFQLLEVGSEWAQYQIALITNPGHSWQVRIFSGRVLMVPPN